MNTYNIVFMAVKRYCIDTKEHADEDCFKTIAAHANIPLDKLNGYLDVLQTLGLIKYSWRDNTIQLMSSGKKEGGVFM